GDRTALNMTDRTLTAMRQGGIYDHLGYGFHRYSVDEKWLVPHFEKMLYDQALLAIAYTEAWQVGGRDLFRRTAEEIFSYVLRDLTAPEGGFYSAEDADSEGEEGRFYVWRPEEITTVLGPELGELFGRYYGVSEKGNFEGGRSVLHLSQPLSAMVKNLGLAGDDWQPKLSEAAQRLLAHRNTRPRPSKDDKIITAWNGLMISALAKAGRAFADYLPRQAATRAADFILANLMTPDHRLLRSWRQGRTSSQGFLEDYAFFIWGLIELYEAGSGEKYLAEARELTRVMIDMFEDRDGGGFFFTGTENELLIARKKETYDGAIPSGNSVTAMNLLRLGRLTGESSWTALAERLLKTFTAILEEYPMAHTHMLMAVEQALTPNPAANGSKII
ncbi:MAG: thioredoxin domain-containing protein, partial [Deltaproteobacteria bacterium]|nr:thioredoxin domain-containing protein [Deltaproteobacteria bacterium]